MSTQTIDEAISQLQALIGDKPVRDAAKLGQVRNKLRGLAEEPRATLAVVRQICSVEDGFTHWFDRDLARLRPTVEAARDRLVNQLHDLGRAFRAPRLQLATV